MRSDLIAMSPKEIGRLECLQLLAQGTIRQAEAARKLGLTVRQIKRLVRAYRSGGAVLAQIRDVPKALVVLPP
jgi:predicted DNA-binding protein (UPF0251 family)